VADTSGGMVKPMRTGWLVFPMLLLAGCATALPGSRPLDQGGALRLEAPINAYGSWVVQGGSIRTGATDATFTGTLLAQLYMQARDDQAVIGPISFGLLPFGSMECPSLVRLDSDGTQSGFGRCTITPADPGQIFANIAWISLRPGEYRGSFTVTGGTGRFRRASGNGPLIIKPVSSEITLTDTDPAMRPSRAPACPISAAPDASSDYTKATDRHASGSGDDCTLERLPFAFQKPAITLQPISAKE
jgi:hypothetical protein